MEIFTHPRAIGLQELLQINTWLMPTADSDWCWLMLTDTDRYWLSLKHQTHPAETYSQDCCCEKNIGRGEVKSCNPLLAKTTHKAMNRFFLLFFFASKVNLYFRQGDNSMMARFSPQITGTVGDIVKDYLNV